MKKNLYLYLFVFAALLAIFLYVNSKNVIDTYERKIDVFQQNETVMKEQLNDLEDQNLDLLYFNLDNNEDALSYFERAGFDVEELIPFLKDELYKLNAVEGEHPLIPYASMTEGKIMINKVRLLNHKWIIADFSDGKHWGELFITYEITPDKELKFKLVEHLMYAPRYQ